MRAMKDSGIEWIGQIPQGWHVDRLKYCTDLDSEKLSEKTDPEYAFNYIDISSVTEYGGIGSTQEMTFDKSPSRARMIVHDGDTIISTVRTYLKAIAYIDGLEDHICSTGFCVVTPNKKLHPKFGYYLLQSDYFVQKIVSESVGVSYPAISSSEIGNMSIAIPDPEEQTRIARHLDNKCAEIDALITAKEKTNALLKERRQSIIYEAVTKGLNPDAPMKDSGFEWIGEIPEHWSVGKTIYGLEMPITDGPHETPQLYSDGVPFVSAEAVSCGNGKIDFDHIRGYISEEYYDECCKKYIPQINDIYMIKSGATTGKVAIVDTERKFTIWSPLAVFRCAESKCHYKYLFYFLQSNAYQKQLEAKWSFGTQQNIGMRTLERLIVCFPGINEQKSIAEYLDTCCNETDHMISANEATIQKLKEYRQSIIYEAVTGKIEV